MRKLTAICLIVFVLVLGGCLSKDSNISKDSNKSYDSRNAPTSSGDSGGYSEPKTAEQPNAGADPAANKPAPASQPQQPQQIPQDKTDNAQANNSAVERKIIRNAEMIFEVSAPDELQRKISSIAESKGGYVVSSDSSQQGGNESTALYKLVKIVLRVPSNQFDATLNEIKSSGAGTPKQEKVTGRDVTEEFIDLEARIKALKATEVQMMEIMKRANTVNELLNVQQQVGQLRAQIESLEGRLRFLQNQASFSTITITLQQPGTFIASPTGFFYRLKIAVGDGLEAASEVVLFIVRAAIALLPLGLLIFAFLYFFVKIIKRRSQKAAFVKKMEAEEQ